MAVCNIDQTIVINSVDTKDSCQVGAFLGSNRAFAILFNPVPHRPIIIPRKPGIHRIDLINLLKAKMRFADALFDHSD